MSFTILSALIVAFAGVHLSNAWGDYIEAEFFHVGMTARAIYTAPSWKWSYYHQPGRCQWRCGAPHGLQV